MSYGSSFAPFEANGRLCSRPSRNNLIKKDFHENSTPKLVRYEKQFDVNLSRIDRPVPDKSSIKESMVAYSKKMRSLQESRFSSKTEEGDPLFVRAKHIPKYPTRPPKKRRPMSFDELLGRDRESTRDRPNGAKQRPKSDKTKPERDTDTSNDNELHLPMLSERLKKTGSNMQVSLVSASDLYDIVDFSLKSKGSRNDSLRLLRLERELGSGNIGPIKSPNHNQTSSSDVRKVSILKHEDYSKYERRNEATKTQTDQINGSESPEEFTIPELPDHVPTDSFYKRIFALGPLSPRTSSTLLAKEAQENESKINGTKPPTLTAGSFKKRPHRAKRMKLYDPGLGDIPEDNIIETKDNYGETIYEPPRVNSPAPKVSPRNLDIANRRSLDAIQEHSERANMIETVAHVNGVIDRRLAPVDPASPRSSIGRDGYTNDVTERLRRNGILPVEEPKVTKKILIRDDGDVRIEVTQCPPKHDVTQNTKLRAQKRFAKKLVYLRDTPR